MSHTSCVRRALRLAAAGLGFAAGAYATYAASAWMRYGRSPTAVDPEERDDLLDRFMPAYEVRTRHHVHVAAPAAITFAAARDMDLLQSPVVRAIIKAREIVLGATPDDTPRPHGLLAEAQALGWGVLAEAPDREVVVGAVTRPWEANVTFRAVPPGAFAAFDEPGYIKIAWTLRADPIDVDRSLFSTETRVASTDAAARERFRLYWSIFSPGMELIRWASLGPLRAEAERRARAGTEWEELEGF